MAEWSTLNDEQLAEIFCDAEDLSRREMALSELMKRHQTPMMRRVYYQLRHRENSEEFLQEFWMDFARGVKKNYHPQRGRLKNWMFGVLQNKVRDFLRRHRPSEEAAFPLEDIEFWDEAKEQDILGAMEKCLGEFPRKYSRMICFIILPPHHSEPQIRTALTDSETDLPLSHLLRDRNLLELADCLIRPLSEVADTIDEITGQTPPLGTVKTQKYRAFHLLQECLRRRGFAPTK